MPAWSPEGTRVAFIGTHRGRQALYVMDVNPKDDGTHRLRLTHDMSADEFPAWSPDGSQIAFLKVTGLGALVPSSYNPVSWLPSGQAVLANTYTGDQT